jgi:hypothetical protein
MFCSLPSAKARQSSGDLLSTISAVNEEGIEGIEGIEGGGKVRRLRDEC